MQVSTHQRTVSNGSVTTLSSARTRTGGGNTNRSSARGAVKLPQYPSGMPTPTQSSRARSDAALDAMGGEMLHAATPSMNIPIPRHFTARSSARDASASSRYERSFGDVPTRKDRPPHDSYRTIGFLPSLQSMKPTTAPEDASPSLIDSRIGLQGVPTKLRQQQRLARLTQRSSSRSLANGNKNNNGSSSRSMNTYGSGAYSGYSSGGGGEEVEWVEKEPLVNGIAQFKHADHLANEMRAYLGVASTGGGGISSEGTMLMPKWTKASRDPGDKLGRVAGGYGRKVDDTSVSMNAPAFLQIPAVMKHVAQTGLGSEFRAGKGGFDLEIGKGKHASVFEQQRDDTAVSEHAPEWFKMKNLVAFQKKLDAGEVPHGHGLGHDSFVHKGRVYFEPKVPGAPLQTKTAIAGNGGYDTRLIS